MLCKRANVRLQAAECSQLRRLLSSDDPNHQRGVMMSIIVTMSAVQSHTPDVTQTRCTVAVHRRWGGSLCGRRPPLLSKAPRISS